MLLLRDKLGVERWYQLYHVEMRNAHMAYEMGKNLQR